ncbi:glycosyl transferase [Gordonia sputi]|uniref:glycosyltransferase n=1 Tax=Gordonia sputi TaxID=36823 RepID=UPI002043BFC7|nr:nucleotide disphospho-sugar-binding domain-containing protein [Gordonia sputi]MCM3893804.1 glycosyl transferase [Gordonia sputi]
MTGTPPRVGIVAGPDAGHAFPAFALAERCRDIGWHSTVFTGTQWYAAAGSRGIDIAELPELRPDDADDDLDAGEKLSGRAARMAVRLAPVLASRRIDLVVSDVITVAGSWAAELTGLPFVELSPHPLYAPSKGLPPVGAGMAPGRGFRGRLRDIAMRAASNRSVALGVRQRAAARSGIGLADRVPSPAARLIATLPALEVWRPDWPRDTHLVGPLLWEPTAQIFERPSGEGPLVVVAPSTAVTGCQDLLDETLGALGAIASRTPIRAVISSLDPPAQDTLARAGAASVSFGLGRQDELLADADLVVCGGGHGMLAKSLLAGVPVVVVPGGGDQWELANRVSRQGSGVLVRPADSTSIAEAIEAVLRDPGHAAAAAAARRSATAVTDPIDVLRGVLASAGT